MPRDPPLSLLDVPDEILLLVTFFLDPLDIIHFAKSCRRASGLAKDRALWIAFYHRQTYELPTPYPLGRFSCNGLESDTRTSDIETLVLTVNRTENTWLLPRSKPRSLSRIPTYNFDYPLMSSSIDPGAILSIDVLLNRWLLAVYQEGQVELWDLAPQTLPCGYDIGFHWDHGSSTPVKRELRYQIQGPASCTASVASVADALITLAVTSQTLTTIIRLSLAPGKIRTASLAIFPTPSAAHKVWAIEPSSQIIVFAHSLSICFLHWGTRSYWTVSFQEDGEEMWNGIIGMKFLTSQHVLCMKTRSVEVYALPFLSESLPPFLAGDPKGPLINCGRREAHALRHTIPETTFRGVSFSEPTLHHSADGIATITISLLAYDVLRGLFNYQVETRFPYSEITRTRPSVDVDILDMNVTLVAAHHMAQLVPPASVLGRDTPTPRSGFSLGSRGFVSACVLGQQGKRGVWVERNRGSVGRAVFGFKAGVSPENMSSAESSSPDTGEGIIHGKRLHEVQNSYDLRDDLTHCAFSEVTGRIILGTRRGELLVL